MFSKAAISALSVTSLFLQTTALPARTRCRCTILDASRSLSPSPELIESTSSLRTSFDICTTLGPELENFRHSQPDLYDNYISNAALSGPTPTSEDDQKPLSTTVLLQLAARNGFQNLGVVLPSAPTERPRERIICHSETEVFSAYQDSVVTLLALQIVVGIAVLACIAEGVTLAMSCISTPPQEQIPPKAVLRLSGEERRLRAFSPTDVFSPGADKKKRVYESANWTPKSSCGKSVFGAYEAYEDEDDEISRPVM